MKILTFVSYYHPHWTGLTVHARHVAEGMAARGHRITVVTTRHAAELPLSERLNGVRIRRLPAPLRFSRGMIAPGFPLVAARLIAAHDVVQVHTPFPEALLVAWLCRLWRRPLLLTHHGDIVMPAGRFNKGVERIAFRTLLSSKIRSHGHQWPGGSADASYLPQRHTCYTHPTTRSKDSQCLATAPTKPVAQPPILQHPR